jgi:hypothetical protein
VADRFGKGALVRGAALLNAGRSTSDDNRTPTKPGNKA